MRSCTIALVLGLAIGCGGGPPPFTGEAGMDASMQDAATEDGNVDVDADGVDATVGDDGSIIDEDGGITGPTCSNGTACGGGDSCAAGYTCVTNACGSKVCQRRAAECASSAECAVGSACTTVGSVEICRPTGPQECNASTDCPPSHTCEGGACVLRRITCVDENDCPRSYQCLGVEGDAFACLYVYRPCDNAGTCTNTICGDVDGAGGNECGGGAACETNATCGGGERCVWTVGASCGLGGLCNESGGDACANGYECLDLGGDGYGECVPTNGECDTHADCDPGQRCVVDAVASPPHCISAL